MLPVPLKTTYKSWTPEAPETLAVTVSHVSQLPVMGSAAVATNGPVRLSRWNSAVPPLPPLDIWRNTDSASS